MKCNPDRDDNNDSEIYYLHTGSTAFLTDSFQCEM